MTIYLLISIFFVLLTIIALAITIGGLIKKKTKLWISALSTFVILSLVSVFSVITYAKKTIDYMATDEFQEETKKSASNWGKNIGNTVSGAAEGLEATLNNKSITKLAEKSGIILGGGIKAISKGLEESIDKQKVFADKEIEKDGIYIGRAEWIASSADKKSSFTLYLEFKKDFKGSLKLTVYDNDGKKIDNAIIEVDEKSGEEKLFVFDFSYLDPTLSEYCILTKK